MVARARTAAAAALRSAAELMATLTGVPLGTRNDSKLRAPGM
jgi:hypothetical protein